MTATEYIANFFLVIIGFAVSELLKGSALLIRERNHIKFYWPYLVVLPLVFEILIFWFLYIFTQVVGGEDRVWSTPDVAFICVQMIPWAFITYLIFPSRVKEGFDLRAFYFENGRVIILITTILTAFVILDMLLTSDMAGLVIQLIALALNLLVLRYFEKLHIVWLTMTIVLVNYFMFVVKPISIG